MATTTKPTPTPTKMAMLTVGGTNFAVTMAEALAVMDALSNAERLDYDYGSATYKLAKPSSSSQVASVSTLSPSQWAVINLAADLT